MTKTNKIKVILSMALIACFVAVFCCMQSAFANVENCPVTINNVSDNASEVKGSVYGSSGTWYFRDINDFRIICFGSTTDDYLKYDKELTIYVNDDLDFYDFTCDIKDGRTFKFVIDQNKSLFSNKNYTLFNVEYDGSLILNSASDHSCVNESSKNSTIKVGEGGKIEADHIWFNNPNDKKIDSPSYGGMFYFENVSKNQIFTSCKFSHNNAGNDGGAIYINSGAASDKKIVFESCTFDECRALGTGFGGAVANNSDDKYDQHIDLEFHLTDFVSCTAGDNVKGGGGAVATFGNGEHTTFNYCTFDKCSGYEGGAIHNYSNPGHYVFMYTTIANCHSYDKGGAIYSRGDNEQYDFINSLIDSCSAENDGGAIHVDSCKTTFNGCDPNKPFDQQKPSVISNCKSNEDGGAICTSAWTNCGNDIKIYDLRFINNKANKAGGAISVNGSRNCIDKCYFEANNASKANTVELFRSLIQGTYSNQIACRNLKSFNIADEFGSDPEYGVKYFTPIEIK